MLLVDDINAFAMSYQCN